VGRKKQAGCRWSSHHAEYRRLDDQTENRRLTRTTHPTTIKLAGWKRLSIKILLVQAVPAVIGLALELAD
jgi:hypothetical protein